MGGHRWGGTLDASGWSVAAGATLTTSIALADVVAGQVVLVGLLSAGPLVAGLRAHPRGTAAVGVYALLLGLLVAVPDGIFGTLDHVVRMLVVVLAAVVGTRMAVLREKAREAGVASRRVVHSVFHSALDCIVSMDGDGLVVDLNRAAEETFGYERAYACGKPLCDLMIPERFRQAHREGLARLTRGGEPSIIGKRIELPAVRAGGEEFPVELTITQAGTEPPLYTGFIRDITERKQAEMDRARAQRHATFLANAGVLLESSLDYKATVDHIARLAVPGLADWAFVEMVQPDGSIERVAMAHTDLSKEALVREFSRRYPVDPDAAEGSAKVIRTGRPELMKEIPDEMLEAVAEDPEQLRILRELGFCSAMVVPLRARGRTLGAIALVSAESGRKYDEAELAMTQELATRCALAIDNALLYAESRDNAEKMRHQALHDSLTGLPNRTLFLDRIELALTRAGRHEGEPALLFFDLDGFKAVNDTRGHKVGDELLAAIPGRLDGLLRGEDTVCRFGGDEFAVLCEDVNAESDAIMIAERIVAALEVPFELDGGRVDIGVSLGIAFAQSRSETPESILHRADAAMYEAKRAGVGFLAFDDQTPEMRALPARGRDPLPEAI